MGAQRSQQSDDERKTKMTEPEKFDMIAKHIIHLNPSVQTASHLVKLLIAHAGVKALINDSKAYADYEGIHDYTSERSVLEKLKNDISDSVG